MGRNPKLRVYCFLRHAFMLTYYSLTTMHANTAVCLHAIMLTCVHNFELWGWLQAGSRLTWKIGLFARPKLPKSARKGPGKHNSQNWYTSMKFLGLLESPRQHNSQNCCSYVMFQSLLGSSPSIYIPTCSQAYMLIHSCAVSMKACKRKQASKHASKQASTHARHKQ